MPPRGSGRRRLGVVSGEGVRSENCWLPGRAGSERTTSRRLFRNATEIAAPLSGREGDLDLPGAASRPRARGRAGTRRVLP